VLVLAMGLIARGATPASGSLVDSQPIFWSGTVPTGEINPVLFVPLPAPEVHCITSRCDLYSLTIALGPGYWAQNGDGAVEVAIKWTYDGIIDLDLQVLDAGGKVIAQSAGVDSNAENVFIPNAADGTYTVRVIPENTFPAAGADEVPFEGMAQVEILTSDPPGQGHQLLPNLVPAPPDGFHIASALNYVPLPENKFVPCYPEETVQAPDHPIKCLRFNQTIANRGEGKLELRFGLSGIITPWDSDNIIDQRIYSSDGSYTDSRLNENYMFHTVHAHLHYKGFGASYLYHWSPTTGRGSLATTGHKVGFCVIDVRLQEDYWGQPGNGPRGRSFPNACFVPNDIDLSAPEAWVVQGVDVGWADVYGWNLADQYVNITGVPDGLYELVQIANPTNSVIETTRDDNCSHTIIRLNGDTVTTPYGPGENLPACPA